MILRPVFVLSLLLASDTIPLQDRTETVASDVMAVLLRGPGISVADGFDLRVGGPPDGFPDGVLPPGASVGVTAVSDRTTTVVGMVPAGVDRLKEEQRLAAGGWRVTPRMRGFVPGPDLVQSVCRESDFLTLSYPERPAGGSYVRASWTREPGRTCVQRPDLHAWFADVPVPSLSAPEGARAFMSGSGSGTDHLQSSARLETTHSVEAIARHYASQMKAAGWSEVDSPVVDADFAVVRFRLTTAGGEAMTAFLTVTALGGDGELDAALRVIRNKVDRRFGPPPSGTIRLEEIR